MSPIGKCPYCGKSDFPSNVMLGRHKLECPQRPPAFPPQEEKPEASNSPQETSTPSPGDKETSASSPEGQGIQEIIAGFLQLNPDLVKTHVQPLIAEELGKFRAEVQGELRQSLKSTLNTIVEEQITPLLKQSIEEVKRGLTEQLNTRIQQYFPSPQGAPNPEGITQGASRQGMGELFLSQLLQRAMGGGGGGLDTSNLTQAIRALSEIATAFNAPFASGAKFMGETIRLAVSAGVPVDKAAETAGKQFEATFGKPSP